MTYDCVFALSDVRQRHAHVCGQRHDIYAKFGPRNKPVGGKIDDGMVDRYVSNFGQLDINRMAVSLCRCGNLSPYSRRNEGI